MPLSFAPKFVDMVRVNSTTQGTGPLVCGSAVQGFLSFADTLVAGDSFYYSIQGTDKPRESEVGRGTLQANGTISRQPLRGSPTNFSSGAKTISLVTAAEWFASIQTIANAADQHSNCANRTVLAQSATGPGLSRFLREAGREGVFVWESSNLSGAVSADPRQGLYVPSVNDATGATGAWVRKFAGPISADWFGAVGDGVSNDAAALQAWLDTGGHLYLPPKHYFSAQKLIVRRQVRIEGGGYGFDARLVGLGSMPGSRIRFPAGQGGLELQNQGTIIDVAAALKAIAAGTWAVQQGASGSVIRDIALIGPGKTAGGAAVPGVMIRALCALQNVHVLGFVGKGFDVNGSADTPDGNSDFGNVSTATLRDCRAEGNGSHGLHVRGRDANTCLFDNFNGHVNDGWGILDESSYGSTYTKPHLAGNSLGCIKTVGGINESRFHDPYVEGGVGSNSQIKGPAMVLGTNLSIENNLGSDAAPLILTGPMSSFGRMRLTRGGFTFNNLSTTSEIFAAENEGLILQGAGASADVTIANKLGQVVANVGGGSKNVSFKGNVSLDGASPQLLLRGGGGIGSQLLMYDAGSAERFQIYAGGTTTYASADALTFRDKTTLLDTRVTIDAAGLTLAAGKALKVGNVQVVGARETGWTAMTGSPAKGALSASAAGTASASYSQGELQGALNRVAALEARLKAYDAALFAHGLIGT